MSQPPTPGDDEQLEIPPDVLANMQAFGRSFLRAAGDIRPHLRWRAGLGERVQHRIDGLLDDHPLEQERAEMRHAWEVLNPYLDAPQHDARLHQSPEPIRITSTPTPEQIEEMRAAFTGFRGSVEGEFVTQPDEPEPEEDDAEWNLRGCIEHNQQDLSLTVGDIKQTLAVVEGEKDERAWHWLLELHDGRFVYLIGGCDYTGWDCQSWASSASSTESPYAAILLCQDHIESSDYEHAQQQLLAQLADGLVQTTRQKIGESLARDGARRHLVVRDRMFSINHMWRCEHCEFLTADSNDARIHSEVRLAVQPKPGRLRGKRRDL